MKKMYKISWSIGIFIFFLLTILQPLWKLHSLEIGNNAKFTKGNDNSVFMEIKNMTAGDCAQDTFIIKNNLKVPFDVKLECEKLVEDNEYNFLLDQLNIAIICEGKELYKGLLSNIDKLKDSYIDLGIYDATEEKNLNIKVYLDNNINLQENEKKNEFKLKFTTNNEENIIFIYDKDNIKSKSSISKENNYINFKEFPLKFKLQLCRVKKIKAIENKLNLHEYVV